MFNENEKKHEALKIQYDRDRW